MRCGTGEQFCVREGKGGCTQVLVGHAVINEHDNSRTLIEFKRTVPGKLRGWKFMPVVFRTSLGLDVEGGDAYIEEIITGVWTKQLLFFMESINNYSTWKKRENIISL